MGGGWKMRSGVGAKRRRRDEEDEGRKRRLEGGERGRDEGRVRRGNNRIEGEGRVTVFL